MCWREENYVIIEVALSPCTSGKCDAADNNGYCSVFFGAAFCHPLASVYPLPTTHRGMGQWQVLANHRSPIPPWQSDGLGEGINFRWMYEGPRWSLRTQNPPAAISQVLGLQVYAMHGKSCLKS